MGIRSLTNSQLKKDAVAVIRTLELLLCMDASSLSVYADNSTLKRRVYSLAQKTATVYANRRTNRSSALDFAELILAAVAEGCVDATTIQPARNQPQPPSQPEISATNANAASLPSRQDHEMNHSEVPQVNHHRTLQSYQPRQAGDNAYRTMMLKTM